MIIIQQQYAQRIAPVIRAFASQRSHLPASCFIKAEAGSDSVDFTTRNDTGAIFTATVPTIRPVDESINVAVTAVSISSWLANVMEDVEFELSSNRRSIWIRDGLSRKKLELIVETAFEPRPTGIMVAELEPDELDAILAETTYAVLSDDVNLVTQGVHMKFNPAGGEILFQATNGMLAAIVECSEANVSEEYFTIVTDASLKVLRATIKAIEVLSDGGNSNITIWHIPTASGNGVVRFTQQAYGLSISFEIIPINMEHPLRDMRGVYNMDGCIETKVTVPKSVLSSHLRKLQSDGLTTLYNQCMVRIEDDVLYFSAATVMDKVRDAAEVGIAEYAVTGDAESFRFRVSLPFMNSVIRALPGEHVTITHYQPADDGWRPVYFSSDLGLGTHFILPIVS